MDGRKDGNGWKNRRRRECNGGYKRKYMKGMDWRIYYKWKERIILMIRRINKNYRLNVKKKWKMVEGWERNGMEKENIIDKLYDEIKCMEEGK